MDKLEMMRLWLEDFYMWGDAQWGLDLTGNTPVSCSVTLDEERMVRRKVDIIDARYIYEMQTQFSFTRISYGEESPGEWAGEFSIWVRLDSENDCAPCFGEGITRFYLDKIKLETLGDKTVYTAKLICTYEEIYEVE